jgi:2-(3-amino-3-carboxypropyl)histidine synthase
MNFSYFIYRYDPYDKKFTEEFYGHTEMQTARKQAISEASNVSRFGLILGTLGRQGSTQVMEHFQVYIKMEHTNQISML